MNTEKPLLKNGYTTGSCATAATAGALELLINKEKRNRILIHLPTGDTASIELADSRMDNNSAFACVKKYSGDDPDITNGALICSSVRLNEIGEIRFIAGQGVGTVTKAGLQLDIGEAAINPVPREMMTRVVNEFTSKGVDITISVKDGEKLAQKTFNPRLGIVGGISIIGTSGIVRPFSHEAIQETVRVNIDVATANGEKALVLVAGHYGMKAAQLFFNVTTDQIIEVSNEWEVALERSRNNGVESILLLSHPGKLAKLIDGYFNTHSQVSPSALPIVGRIAKEEDIAILTQSTTVEGIFRELPIEASKRLATRLAKDISLAVQNKFEILKVGIVLIDMQNNQLGLAGELNTWEQK